MARNYSSVVEPKTLTSTVSSVATQITLNNVTGLPSPPYVLVLNPDTAKEEAVLVTVDQTGVTSPTLKVTRAIEASGGVGVAQEHTIGDTVKHMIVGSDLQIVHDHFSNDNTTTGTAHGATGGVVGRTNSQTLTNKTIDLTNNTLLGTKAEFNAALEDADFATIAGTETLTGKTINSANNTLTIAQSAVTNLASDLALKAPIANPTFTGTVSGVSKSMVGLGNVDNTSDANKPISTATQTALNLKLNESGGTVTGILNVASEGDLRVAGDVVRASVGGTGSASSSGVTTVNHGLGTIPSSVVATMRTAGTTTGSPRIFYVSRLSSTQFDIYALDTAGNQQSGAFYWIAIA